MTSLDPRGSFEHFGSLMVDVLGAALIMKFRLNFRDFRPAEGHSRSHRSDGIRVIVVLRGIGGHRRARYVGGVGIDALIHLFRGRVGAENGSVGRDRLILDRPRSVAFDVIPPGGSLGGALQIARRLLRERRSMRQRTRDLAPSAKRTLFGPGTVGEDGLRQMSLVEHDLSLDVAGTGLLTIELDHNECVFIRHRIGSRRTSTVF